MGINGLSGCNIHVHQMLKGLKGLKKKTMDLFVYSAIYNSSQTHKSLHRNILILVCQVSNLHKNKAFHKIKITLRNVAKLFLLYHEHEYV